MYGSTKKHITNKNKILRGDNMFCGVYYNPIGLTAKELLRYFECVVAHGDGNSIVYASSKPVTMISCEPTCVLMEVRDSE